MVMLARGLVMLVPGGGCGDDDDGDGKDGDLAGFSSFMAMKMKIGASYIK